LRLQLWNNIQKDINTVSSVLYSSSKSLKMAIPDSQRYPLNFLWWSLNYIFMFTILKTDKFYRGFYYRKKLGIIRIKHFKPRKTCNYDFSTFKSQVFGTHCTIKVFLNPKLSFPGPCCNIPSYNRVFWESRKVLTSFKLLILEL